ncbi:conserved hypothetical protein [Ricinus communis]|uniref:Xyloglucan endotransglucosylase/hydrolase n=1 Tax=Ricinus communis TaxID=3988 RepID=B9SX21_RICCO|nr:conserved hypothetical protein [Ricinus communis]
MIMNFSTRIVMLVGFYAMNFLVGAASGGDFNKDFDITWGDGRAKILNNGQLLTLSLDKSSGSGFKSKNQYLFGKIDMQLKLVPGNSAGTVTTYYLSSLGTTHDEIDFEFLDDWATRGGLVKTDWSQAPFIASYRNFNAQACIWSSGSSSCSSNNNNNSWLTQFLDTTGQARIKWVQKNYMIYNYCSDAKRFPQGLPLECSLG